MKTTHLLSVMKVLTWFALIFIVFNTINVIIALFFSIFTDTIGSKAILNGFNFNDLKEHGNAIHIFGIFLVLGFHLLRIYTFYLILKIMNNLKIEHPFNEDIAKLISLISYVTFGLGFLAIIGSRFEKYLLSKQIMIDIDWNTIDYMYLAGVIFIIALVFKRGIEIQTENELTV